MPSNFHTQTIRFCFTNQTKTKQEKSERRHIYKDYKRVEFFLVLLDVTIHTIISIHTTIHTIHTIDSIHTIQTIHVTDSIHPPSISDWVLTHSRLPVIPSILPY